MCEEINYSGEPPLHYAPFEVVIHNSPQDCWVSFLGKVWNITPLVNEYDKDDKIIKTLLTFAGKDISDWFDESNGEIVHYIHPVTGVRVPYLPHGIIPDVQVYVPATNWKPLDHTPWWKDTKYKVGLLSKRVRPIRIINVIFGLEVCLNVCCEDTILRIKERYSIFNKDANNYIWKYFDKTLKDDLNLEENGIMDERDKFANVGLPPTFYIPAVTIFYSDDFNWAKKINNDINKKDKLISAPHQ